jgi:hypothetical protein
MVPMVVIMTVSTIAALVVLIIENGRLKSNTKQAQNPISGFKMLFHQLQ